MTKPVTPPDKPSATQPEKQPTTQPTTQPVSRATASPLPPAASDLVQRQPVWSALSDLFLDTDVSLSLAGRVATLARSPYSVEQIEAILIDEVYPVCRANLLQVAGEWAAFDDAWLQERIVALRRSPWRALRRFDPGRRAILASADWQATRAGLIAARLALTA